MPSHGIAPQNSKSKLHYNRRSAGQSVLEQSTHLGLTTRSWLLSDTSGFVGLGRSLWREESAVCNCCWPLPAQSFSGPSPLGLAAIFCCLKFETTLFVDSYDSQGHGGGIRSRLHTGILKIPVLLPDIDVCANRIEHTVPNGTSNGYVAWRDVTCCTVASLFIVPFPSNPSWLSANKKYRLFLPMVVELNCR
jgi:hypothetical protein